MLQALHLRQVRQQTGVNSTVQYRGGELAYHAELRLQTAAHVVAACWYGGNRKNSAAVSVRIAAWRSGLICFPSEIVETAV
jgi:hypothetical protein